MPQPMMPKPWWAMGVSIPVRVLGRRSDQAYSGDLALADPDDQAVGNVDQGLGIRDGFPLRTDIEAALLDHPPGVRGARIESQLLDQNGRGDPAFGIELVGRERDIRNLIGVLAAGPPTELSGRLLGCYRSVILRDDGLAKRFLGVPGVHTGREQGVDFRHWQVGQQREILPHRLVGNTHHLAKLMLGRFGHPDVIPQALAHPPDAVGADQDRHRESDLGLLALGLLQVARYQQTEELLGSSEFDIGPDLDRIPALHEGIEALMEIDWLFGGDSLGEVFAGAHLAQGHVPHQVENLEERPFREPVAVVVNLRSVQVDDPADLLEVIAGVGFHLRLGQFGPGLVAAGGVADQGRIIADDDAGRVAQVLELPELAQGNRVAEMDVDSGRVDPVLDSQRPVRAERPFELVAEFVFGNNLFDPAAENAELFIKVRHRRAWLLLSTRSGSRRVTTNELAILGWGLAPDKVAEPRNEGYDHSGHSTESFRD